MGMSENEDMVWLVITKRTDNDPRKGIEEKNEFLHSVTDRKRKARGDGVFR
jgi:hypothetical protein